MKMATAFVLINSEIGSEEKVLKDLRKIKNVEEAYAVVNLASGIAIR
ncbi:hypothetical protein ISS96_03110 [Candidatus Bathyarchaeota archaeon]|nr:hypothetical protein [Candidatus Bathyarchaeota archaeon]